MKTFTFAALLWWGTVAAAVETPGDFAWSAAIAVPGGSSHYRFSLPAAAYAGTERSDLGDLRIFNMANESLPYAILSRSAESAAPAEARAIRLFALYGSSDKGMDGLSLQVERNRSGSMLVRMSGESAAKGEQKKLLGYIADAASLDRPMQALLLEWNAKGNFSGAARVETSADLKRWSTLVADAPLVWLEQGGERLERRRIDLATTRTQYLRLTFRGVPDGFELRELRAELSPPQRQTPREWQLRATRPKESPPANEFMFDVEGRYPVDRIRFRLPQINTVVPLQLLVRDRDSDKWRPLAAATVYRLAQGDGEVSNPDLEVPTTQAPHWLIRIDPKSGGIGAGQLSVEFGYVPHELIFSARGEGPFALAWGRRATDPVALPITTVLPGYRQGDAVFMPSVSIGEPVRSAAAIAGSLMRNPATAIREAARSGDLKKWLLWATLVLGAVLIAWMALRLLRELDKAPHN